MNTPRFTPDRITKLEPGEIFVFGSNVQGVHGAGAAKDAARLFGAKRGIGIGFTGQCYAIPTRSYKGGSFTTLPLKSINMHVNTFLADASAMPGNVFLVTQIGCGYAGLSPEKIAQMFKVHPANVILPKSFHDIIHKPTP
jgi:hypothetical protein